MEIIHDGFTWIDRWTNACILSADETKTVMAVIRKRFDILKCMSVPCITLAVSLMRAAELYGFSFRWIVKPSHSENPEQREAPFGPDVFFLLYSAEAIRILLSTGSVGSKRCCCRMVVDWTSFYRRSTIYQRRRIEVKMKLQFIRKSN